MNQSAISPLCRDCKSYRGRNCIFKLANHIEKCKFEAEEGGESPERQIEQEERERDKEEAVRISEELNREDNQLAQTIIEDRQDAQHHKDHEDLGFFFFDKNH
jgi:hypothetical protein